MVAQHFRTPSISRTVITFEVIHRTDQPLPTFAHAIEAAANGAAIGTTTNVSSEPLPNEAVGDALRKLAANAAYFDQYITQVSA